jgi:diguanylate cyclase (GGDEF)-like protein/PAS domain S-box-containing protein
MYLNELITFYLFSVCLACVFCAARLRVLNRTKYTVTTVLLCVAVCFYILGYAMELNAPTPIQILFWNRIEYIGIPFVSALWLMTTLLYTEHFNRYKGFLLAAIFAIPFITFFMRLTNDYHHLYFVSVDYVERFGILFFVKKTGPWMYVQIVHSASMIFASMILLINDSVKETSKSRCKIALITAASLFAVAGLLLSQIKPFGFYIDYMALCLPVTSLFVILAISRYDLLNTRSIARSKVFEASSDAILMLDSQNKILDFNNSAKALFDTMHICLDHTCFTDLAENTNDLLKKILQNTQPIVAKLRINDEDHFYSIATENIDDKDTLSGFIKTIRDVTEIYQLNEELKILAMTDELSVLSNRRAFINTGKEWVSTSEEKGSSLHLLMMDFDQFKSVNDRFGHPTGDFVIREFAQILKDHFSADSLVARLGGEEFAVLLSGYEDKALLQLVKSFLKKLELHTYNIFGNQFHVTSSIGMTKKEPGQTLESMLRKADMALYQSKDLGGNHLTVL